MRRLLTGTSVIAFALALWGCTGTVEKSSANNAAATNANAAAPAANTAAPTAALPAADTLLAIEKKSWEDWSKKDAKGLEGFLAAKFAGVGRLGVTDRAGTMKTWTDHKCEMASVAFSDAKVTPITDGAVMLTSKVTHDIKCDGKPEPSPVYESTLYIKDGDSWKAAYYQEVDAAEAKGQPAPAKPRTEDFATSMSAPSAEIAALEKTLWDAWKARDQKGFEALLAAKGFSNGRTGFKDRAGYVASAFDPGCKVESYELGPMKSMEIGKDAVLVTYRAAQKGACGKDAFPPIVWAASIDVRENGKWVNLYYMESPGV